MADTTSRPGWYRDPGGEAEWRWWDGTAWTAATHTASGVSATAASGGARLRPSSTRSRSSQATALLASGGPQQWRAIAVLGALFVVAVAVVTSAIVLTGGPGNGPPDPAAGTTGGTLPAEAPPDASAASLMSPATLGQFAFCCSHPRGGAPIEHACRAQPPICRSSNTAL